MHGTLYQVFVHNLLLEATIGVHPNERKVLTQIRIDVDVHLTKLNEKTYSLAETLDYGEIVEMARKLAKNPIALLETFAEQLAQSIFDFSVQAHKIEISVSKQTPYLPGADRSVGVLLHFERD